MNRTQPFVFSGVVLALSAMLVMSAPISAHAIANESGKAGPGQKLRMQRAFGHEAPLISLALKHKSELNLSADQVSNLESIRSNFQNQARPIQEQLRAVEGEVAALLQESPANLIQVKLKIEEAEKLRSELRYLRVESIENGKSVLNAQQKDQLKNLVASGHRGFRRPQQGQPS